MNKLTQTMLQSLAILLAGVIAIGALMFAFSPDAQARETGPSSVGSALEIILSDNGHAVVRGAEVTAISDSAISARTVWDEASLTWTIRTDGGTEYLEKNGTSARRNDIRIGDYVSFSGAIDGDERAFAVDADVVKNWSKDSTASVLTGTVTDIDDDSFTIRIKGDTLVTVELESDTTFAGGDFDDLDEGDRIVVSGSYDATQGVIDATKVSVSLAASIAPIVHDWKDWMKDMPVFNWFKKNGR
ncbi:MAG TPA: DUF5666 domain-containing protein [Candidatus Paceibacterota bacterium]|nr:DUF5666 domain-containing protein [Candidatus Paceibacterota bacterium]